MSKKRILIITQEMQPYLNGTEMGNIARELPQYALNKGNEIRVLMPRYGTINERRHRLHEVVRLSGMNIILNDDDYPLIIKVASVPGVRLQVYFLDNEDLFKRKHVFHDEKNNFYEDNAERMVFFCKAAIETVKKFQWPPDIVHCHGWMTSLIPLYLKTAYKSEPVFQHSKVIFSLYKSSFNEALSSAKFLEKVPITNAIDKTHLNSFKDYSYVGLSKGATKYADGVIIGSNDLDKELTKYVKSLGKPVLENVTGDGYLDKYAQFYESVLQT
jgi:starch synthase